MQAAKKLTAEVWKNWSLPPPPSFFPFCKDSSKVSAVSDAAAKLGIYFRCIGLTLREWLTSTKLMTLNWKSFFSPCNDPDFLFKHRHSRASAQELATCNHRLPWQSLFWSADEWMVQWQRKSYLSQEYLQPTFPGKGDYVRGFVADYQCYLWLIICDVPNMFPTILRNLMRTTVGFRPSV